MRTFSSSSYDELAQRHRGIETVAGRASRRRSDGGAAPGADEEGCITEVPPMSITTCALSLGKARDALHVPAVDGDTLRDVAARIDDKIGFVTPIIGGLLEAFPKVGPAVRLTPQGLDESLKQRTEMFELKVTATQLRADVMDTRRQTSGELREWMRTLVGHLRSLLEPGRLPKQDQDRLRSDATELLAEWEKVEQEPLAEREKTQLAARAHEAALSEEETETQLVRTMLALQSGAAVDQAEWDQAAETYDALTKSGAALKNRRTRGR